MYHGWPEPLSENGRLGPAMIAGSNKEKNVTGKRPPEGAVAGKKSVIQQTKNEPVVGEIYTRGQDHVQELS